MATKYKLNGKWVTQGELHATVDASVLQDVFESRQFPGLNTDTSFVAGRGTLSEQLGNQADLVCNSAIAEGYTPQPSDIYLSSLADFPGDPKAFVKHDGAKQHVKDVCEEKGVPCEGSVKYTPTERKPPEQDVELADDIVSEVATDMAKKNPALLKATNDEIRKEVTKRHGPKGKR